MQAIGPDRRVLPQAGYRRWRGSLPLDLVGVVVLTLLVMWGAVGEARTTKYGTVPHPPDAAFLLVALACVVLPARRRWPVATFGVSLAAVVVYTGLGYVNGAALVAVMVALYAVTVSRPRRQALLAAAVALVLLWTVNAAVGPFGVLGGSQTVLPFEVAAIVSLGVAVANRRAFVAAIQDRAERAERSREQEAQRRVDAERLRIARELHDVVAHTMALINVQASAASHVIHSRPEQAAEGLRAIKAASKEGLAELRAILNVLRQADDPESTAPAPGLGQLEGLATSTSRAGLPTTVTVRGRACRLSPLAEVTAYRIIQESLTNAVRHAGPATARVLLDYRPDRLVIEIADTGRGPAAPSADGSGHGLVGMVERAAALGGTVDAGPGPAGGFLVRASLPAGEAAGDPAAALKAPA